MKFNDSLTIKMSINTRMYIHMSLTVQVNNAD